MDKVVYTALSDEQDAPHEPTHITEGWEYRCYTNNDSLKSDVWKFTPLQGNEPQHIRQRKHAIKYFDLIDDAQNIAMYIAPRVRIRGDLNVFLKNVLADNSAMTVINHPTLNCSYREAEAIKYEHPEHSSALDRQIAKYKQEGFPQDAGLISPEAFVYRNHNFRLREFCNFWYEEFSHPNNAPFEQLSFNYTVWSKNLVNISAVAYTALNSACLELT